MLRCYETLWESKVIGNILNMPIKILRFLNELILQYSNSDYIEEEVKKSAA